MKLISTLVMLALSALCGLAADPFQNVTVTTNGVLRTPTNFFTANSNSVAEVVTTNSIPGLATALGDLQSGKQPTNTALTALAGNPALYQATNANLTTVSALTGGTSSNYLRGDGSFAQVATNQIPGHDGHIANLQTAISARQPASSVLTNVSALTSGTSTNFLAGDGTFKQVTTNMIPGHNGDISNLQSAITARQVASAALTNLAANDGSALTNVARIGLGQPEVSGVAFDGATSGTKLAGPSQIIGTNDFSIWMRVRMPSAVNSKIRDWLALTPNASSANPGGAFRLMTDNSGAVLLYVYGASSSDYTAIYQNSFMASRLSKTVDFIFTRQGTNVAFYADDVLQTMNSTQGGTPPGWGAYITNTFITLAQYNGGTANILDTTIYRTAVFNRALSAADVQSLVKNGIDPSDQWGNSTVPVVSFNPSTLNGGFETNSLNAAGTWATTAVGGSTVTIDTSGTNSHSGSNAARLGVDASDNFAIITANNGGNVVAANARYRSSYWAKYGVSSSGAPQFRLESPSGTVLATNTFTSSYQQFTTEFTPTAAGIIRLVRHNSASSSTNYVDDFELTRIGAILDLDFTTGGGTNVFDRSSNSLNATNYGGVSWTMPRPLLSTGTLRATNVTATYLNGDGGGITSTGATNQNQLVTLSQLESFTANGLHMFFYGSSNAAGINSGAAGHTNWAYSTASSSAAVTNTVASPTNSQYLCEFVSNDTFTQFASGVVNIEMWMFFNSGGGRAVSVLAEAYIYDSVGGTNYVGLTPATAAQDLSGTLTKYLYSIPSADITPPNASRLVIKFKVGSVASTPTVSMVSQGVYTSHAAFSVPLSSYVLKTGDTMTGALTLPSLSATNYVDIADNSSAGNPASGYARLMIVPSGATKALVIKWSDGTTNTIVTK